MTPELLLLKKIQKLTARRDKISYEIYKKQELLQEICPHTDYKKEVEYEEGGYLDRSEYVYYSVCQLCGKKELIKSEIGSYI